MISKLKLTASCLLLLLAVSLHAYDRATYYRNANGKSAASLKTALYSIIKNPSVTSYDGLYEGYKKTDTRPDGYVRDWYSKTTNYRHVTDKAGSYNKEGDCYNREHSVPQSWFDINAMKSDIVHVLPTDGYVNNRRSNYPFGEVGSATYTSNGGYCKLGSCKTQGYSGTVFEPGDDIKGDIARIYFYVVTCYEEKAKGWGHSVFSTSTYPGLEKWTLDMFIRWAKNDPVDSVETARNNAVMEVQGNRNPYVDFPGLEQYVWGLYTEVPLNVDEYVDPFTGDIPDNPDNPDNPSVNPPVDSIIPTHADGSYYARVKTTPEDWSGTYLIVNEKNSVALNGTLIEIDMANNFITVTIENDTIAVNEETEKAEFEVTSYGQGYVFLGKSGRFMGTLTADNKITTSGEDSPIVNYITLTDDGVNIKSEYNTYLRYNESGKRFRYYKKSSQQPIALYRRSVNEEPIVDGIEGLKAKDKGQKDIYDLAGRRLNVVTRPGLYIVGGKKQYIK